ncbi:hypothetical protein BDR04DRAFT_1115310 [Suillus decipiens]|nr:hypothetical protein BDR04DRAFT_1115310 [Suillus decipiens]
MHSHSGLEPFNYSPRQETASLNPPRSSPAFSVEPPWLSFISSHTNAVTALNGTIPSDDPLPATSHQNFQGDSFIDYGALRYNDDTLPVASPDNMASTITVSQTTDSAWATSAFATRTPELETSAHNSYQPIHSPFSHVVASSSLMWPVHGPVHTGTVHSLEVLHEDRRTAMLQESPQSSAHVPSDISWYPQVEVAGSSATAVFQSPSIRSRPTASALRNDSTHQCSVFRHDETATMSPQMLGTESTGHEPASRSLRRTRRASWSSYADRPAKALCCNGISLDEEDIREARSINGGLVVTYLCRWTHNGQECGMHVMGDRIRLARHIQRWHRDHAEHSQRQTPCRWAGCGKVMKRENVVRHVIVAHLKMKWCCSVCRVKLSRDDASARHFERVKSCKHGVATVERGPEAREVDVCQGMEF